MLYPSVSGSVNDRKVPSYIKDESEAIVRQANANARHASKHATRGKSRVGSRTETPMASRRRFAGIDKSPTTLLWGWNGNQPITWQTADVSS